MNNTSNNSTSYFKQVTAYFSRKKKLRVPCHSGKAVNPADVVWDVEHWAQIQALRLDCSLQSVYLILSTVTRGSNV
ncbi:hypothetical protein [Pseudoalteromonas sp. ASV78]|uniref:hypothetical protein n=1 Tax=Pseudoalteromonas sp. ASV78 TaxID=3397851 RepID=UPI0039FB94F4